MKILVTGATGFLGGWVLKQLCQEYGKEHVIGTGRNAVQIAEMQKKGFNLAQGDLLNLDFVRNTFQDVTHIIHCAALSSPWGSYDSFYQNNVGTTLNLLRYIPKIERFIFISTPSLYFNFTDRLNIKESDPLPKKFVNHYAATKYLAEKEVLSFAKKDLTRFIIRPRAIIGAGDTVIIPRLIRAYTSGRLKIIGDGENIGDFSSVKNIAHAISLALKCNHEYSGKVFNITDDDSRKIWPLLESTLVRLGYKTKLKKVNYSLVYFIALLSEFISRISNGKEPALTRYGVGVLRYSLTMDISEAKKYLDYKPIISSEDSINEFVRGYLNE